LKNSHITLNSIWQAEHFCFGPVCHPKILMDYFASQKYFEGQFCQVATIVCKSVNIRNLLTICGSKSIYSFICVVDMTSFKSGYYWNLPYYSHFLSELEDCGMDPIKVAGCFLKNSEGFVIYAHYCTNYPRFVPRIISFIIMLW
jgi:hypothetical protein